MNESVREPKQKRAIEKKEKIIKAGFELICENGYYNTNTAEIAKAAGVSTGIVYQYFKDKYDILIEGLEKYGDSIFFPLPDAKKIKFDKDNFEDSIKTIIKHYLKNHKVSNIAHEEIMAMVHSDKKVAEYYYNREITITKEIKELLIQSGFNNTNLSEKVHIVIGMIDNLCHEITYHKHSTMDYDLMMNLVIKTITNILKED